MKRGGEGWPELGHLHAVSGKKGEARKILEELKSRKPPPSYAIAFVYAGLGDREQTLAWLDRAYQGHLGFQSVSIRADPYFDDLRSDTRFSDLLRRIGLPP